ncbi:Uncharacterized protein TCM_043966 [Theobroma cacao]|uniref:Uncharacterized protein n=1 Tax=Theobroma cacao TaxID=3641 RepID=A0A061FPH3_THECC|nr:Uncharacterized protein TCM_043966 [Theobroma cacao]
MKMIEASRERMQMLEENNRWMLETISQLTSFTLTIFQAQLVYLNGDENASYGSTPLVVNTNVNEENATNVVGVRNPNLINSFVVVMPTTTSTAIIPPTIIQSFVTMEQL